MQQIDLDNLLDYKQAYACIEGAKISGSTLTGLCPFHGDKKPSFSVNLENGLYKCFSCGAEGNYLSFVAAQKGISTKDAYIEILREHGLDERGVKIGTKQQLAVQEHYTVDDYAKEKALPADWLREFWRMNEGTDKSVGAFLRIPYFDAEQNQLLFRKRYPKGASKRFAWSNGAAGKLVPYGIWLIEKIREAGYCVLCEGESDTQTLWKLGIPALGVPGATTFKAEWAAQLAGLKLYLHIEPDAGGQTFRKCLLRKLYDGEFLGEVFTFSCGPTGHKDPSELLIKLGAAPAEEKLRELILGAKTVDLVSENNAEAIPGAPVNLKQPEGWIYSEKGISIIEERTQQPKCICRTPIILTKRLKNELGEEKIEIAFRRDGEWRTRCMDRTTVFQSRSITCLAEYGCTVTSENAKYVVSFLQALEAENMDALEVVDATSHFGWQNKDRFLPGLGGSIVLDMQDEVASIAAGYCKNGSMEAWLNAIGSHRIRPIFRAFIAASFAAPLIRVLNVRNFMFYSWADSGSGKTAALKAALSAWGDPNKLMISCNTTKVALERRAALFPDLPFGIDERQAVGSNQQEFLETLTYMLINGIGKSRGAKGGGVQEVLYWKTVAIMTGEEPLTKDSSRSGIQNRMLEIYGAPFDTEQQAAMMHRSCDENCGWAGPKFVENVILHRDELRERYEMLLQQCSLLLGSKNQANAASIACLALADESASKWLWGQSEKEAEDGALGMAAALVQAIVESNQEDDCERALQFVQAFVQSNWSSFKTENKAQSYGWVTDDRVCIYPNVLRDALENAKFSSRKALRAFADRGIMDRGADGKLSIPKWCAGTRTTPRVFVFKRFELLGPSDGNNRNSENFSVIDNTDPLPFL